MAFARHGDPVALGGRLTVNVTLPSETRVVLAMMACFSPASSGVPTKIAVPVDLKRRAAITEEIRRTGVS